MALSKRKSREIVVDNVPYRWAVSVDSAFGVVVIQHANGSGQRLEAQISQWDRGDHRTVTPAGIAALISFALTQGWEPDASGPPVRLRDVDKAIELFA